MKRCRGLLVIFLLTALLLTGCQEIFPQEWSYSNVRAYWNIPTPRLINLTDEELVRLCDMVINAPLQEISAEEATGAGKTAWIEMLAGCYPRLEFTCGLKHYTWDFANDIVTCTIKPLVGKETMVYYLSGALSDKVYDFLQKHAHGGKE